MPRHLDDLTPLSRRVLASALAVARRTEPVVFAVDATAGNGHDTLFLASEAGGSGTVWAFDVQRTALASTQKRLETENPELPARVRLVHAGHERAAELLPEAVHGRLRAVTFNLGFLPGSDRLVVTRAATTIAALGCFAAMLAVGGVISVHAYRGHDGGEEEGGAVARWFADLPWEAWRVAEYSFRNKPRNPETLFLAEKLR